MNFSISSDWICHLSDVIVVKNVIAPMIASKLAHQTLPMQGR